MFTPVISPDLISCNNLRSLPKFYHFTLAILYNIADGIRIFLLFLRGEEWTYNGQEKRIYSLASFPK